MVLACLGYSRSDLRVGGENIRVRTRKRSYQFRQRWGTISSLQFDPLRSRRIISGKGNCPCYGSAMYAEPALPLIEPVLRFLNIAGLSVFAVSGALAAARKRLDIIAACFFAIVAATGGGTMRDILIGAPVFWMTDPAPLVICLAVAITVWLVPLHWWPVRALDWFDAAGLAAYAVYGAAKALSFGIAPLPAAAMGVVTSSMGGVIRDVVAGEPSILLRNELYVTAAVLAAALFVGLNAAGMPAPWPSLIGVGVGFALRGAAIRFGLALPRHRG